MNKLKLNIMRVDLLHAGADFTDDSVVMTMAEVQKFTKIQLERELESVKRSLEQIGIVVTHWDKSCIFRQSALNIVTTHLIALGDNNG